MLEKHPSLIFYFYLANLGAYSPILTTVPSISYAKAPIQKKHHSKYFLHKFVALSTKIRQFLAWSRYYRVRER